MYQLYIGNKNYSSWSLRPWALMRELNIRFVEQLVPFADGSSFDKFRKFSPNGKVPCLVDEDTVVWDSLGITEYLAERHSEIWPADRAARAWARCATAEMHSGFNALRQYCTMNCGLRIRLHLYPDELARDVRRIAELWHEGFDRFGGPYLAGQSFSAVDAFFAPIAMRVQTYGLELPTRAAEYAKRLRELRSMREWYDAALAETWREPGHEDEARAAGTWLEDLRANA
jgi:glutathione S-transferase